MKTLARLKTIAVALSFLFLFEPVAYAEQSTTRVVNELSPRNVRFMHIDSVRGLSQDSVHAIAQDHNGFVWIATQEGLNRYDGQEVVVFERSPMGVNSLSHNWVFDLFVANDGRLWAGTDGGGISVFDTTNEEFSFIKHDPENSNSLSSNRVRSVHQDRMGNVWVGTVDAGLNRISKDGSKITRFRHDPANPGSLPKDDILTIAEDRRGRLWVGTDGGGLARFDPSTESFSRYQPGVEAHTIGGQVVAAILEDRDGALWVGTRDAGLQRLDTESGKFVSFTHDRNDPASLSNNYVRDILEDRDGTLWIATDNGLNEWRPIENGFARYYSVDSDVASLSTSRLTDLFQTADGVLWVGSYRGVDTWNYMSDAFTHYRKSNGMLPTDLVTSISETSDGKLWIGTYGGGLTGIDRRENTVIEVRHDADDAESLSSDSIMVVYVDSKDIVWAGSRNSGLNRYDPKTGEIQHFQTPVISSDSVSALWGDADGTLWIGTFGGGLNRIDPNGDVVWFQHDEADPNTLGSDRVLTVTRDRQNVLWVGTEEGGLNRFHTGSQSFERIMHDPQNADSISANTAWEITETTDGSLWIATLSGGLNQWRAEDRIANRKRFVKWTKEDGLRSNTVYGLLEDDLGRLWLSSNRGITRLNLNDYQMRHYDRRNGLIGDEFNQGARYRSRMGQLLFGGFEGVVAFVPGLIQNNQEVPPTVLRAFHDDEQIAVSYNNQKDDVVVEVDYENNSVTFKFIALDYANPDKHHFVYMLEGFNEDWLDPGQVRGVNYAQLPAGEYTFRVRASNSDGVWNENDATLGLVVRPPLWQTKYAYAFYSILLLIGAWFALRWYMNRRQREIGRRANLEAQVMRRTAELDERNRELEKLNERLMEASFTDSLTELYNRRYLDQFIEQQVHSINRESHEKREKSGADYNHFQQSVLSFMMIDLDGFKAINDAYGHAAGDLALLQVRDVLLDCVRESDTVIRWGGDEFLIVGRTLGLSGIANFAERVRFAISERVYEVGHGHTASMSCSIGAVPYPFAPLRSDLMNWEQVLNVADACAYIVKANGRNGWVVMSGTAAFEAMDVSSLNRDFETLIIADKVQLTTSIREPLKLPFKDESAA